MLINLGKIMSPIRKEADPNIVGKFCQKVNSDLEGPHIACDLIISKLQSSQDWEIYNALYVLEACVKNCGERFHQLIGRFRFLNEMIKLVSPKYSGNKTSERVKKKCIELFFSWSRGLPQEVKIKEAYDMLKRQDIVKSDPVDVDELVINVTPRQKDPIFDNEAKSKELARLLKSKNANDLEEANRLIKNMVKQDEIKTEKISMRINELEHINNNMKLLNDMLLHYTTKTATQSETDTMKYLFEELTKMQPNLIKLATETEENDESIGDILKANDQCERIIDQYKQIVINTNTNASQQQQQQQQQQNKTDSDLLNFLTKDDDFMIMTDSHHEQLQKLKKDQINSETLFDPISSSKSSYDPLKELEDLFAPSAQEEKLFNFNSTNSSLMKPLQVNNNINKSLDHIAPFEKTAQKVGSKMKGIDDLNELSRCLMENSINNPQTTLQSAVISAKTTTTTSTTKPNQLLTLNDIKKHQNDSNNAIATDTSDIQQQQQMSNSLQDLTISLESIKPAFDIPAVVLYDENQCKIVMHFALNSPGPNINVVVISVTNFNVNKEMKNFVFQAAVTKVR
jgi:ADP-ribosylation factor-binding protein GGA